MSPKRITPRPSASKRTRPAELSPLFLPTKAVEGLRALFETEPATAPARECAVSRQGTGVEAPSPRQTSPANHLERSFAFVDVSGFTVYVDRHGEHEAIELLTRFRTAVREISARRGVRVGKWLGDGVMLVGTEPAVVVASAAEMLCRFAGTGIDLHAGLAGGPVLLYEGDDYIGRPVNLAARLCDAAGPGELLALVEPEELPEWIRSDGDVTVRVAGVGDVDQVQQLVVTTDVLDRFRESSAA